MKLSFPKKSELFNLPADIEIASVSSFISKYQLSEIAFDCENEPENNFLSKKLISLFQIVNSSQFLIHKSGGKFHSFINRSLIYSVEDYKLHIVARSKTNTQNECLCFINGNSKSSLTVSLPELFKKKALLELSSIPDA